MSKLQGMKEICRHSGYSEPTILSLIRYRGLKASMIGGVWISDTTVIDDFFRRQIEDDETPGELRGRRRETKPKQQGDHP